MRPRISSNSSCRSPAPSVVVILPLCFSTLAFMRIEDMSRRDAFYFCCTLLTTVGYGDIAPETVPGKAFTMVYILLGLTLVTTCIGTIISEGAHLATAGPPRLPSVQRELRSLALDVLLVLAVNCIGAYWVVQVDGVSVFDGFYWALITSTSVGFGTSRRQKRRQPSTLSTCSQLSARWRTGWASSWRSCVIGKVRRIARFAHVA